MREKFGSQMRGEPKNEHKQNSGDGLTCFVTAALYACVGGSEIHYHNKEQN